MEFLQLYYTRYMYCSTCTCTFAPSLLESRLEFSLTLGQKCAPEFTRVKVSSADGTRHLRHRQQTTFGAVHCRLHPLGAPPTLSPLSPPTQLPCCAICRLVLFCCWICPARAPRAPQQAHVAPAVANSRTSPAHAGAHPNNAADDACSFALPPMPQKNASLCHVVQCRTSLHPANVNPA